MTQANPQTNYLRTRVMTAGPAELRLMLLDGAIKFAMQARDGLNAKDFEAVFNGVTNCRNIVVELMTNIRPDVEPTLADRVKALYAYLFMELTNASMEKSVAKFDAVIKLLEYERETWSLLMQKLGTEKASPAAQPGSLAASA